MQISVEVGATGADMKYSFLSGYENIRWVFPKREFIILSLLDRIIIRYCLPNFNLTCHKKINKKFR